MESRQRQLEPLPIYNIHHLVASKVAVLKDRGHRRAVCINGVSHLLFLKVGLGSGCYSDTKVTHMPQAQSTFGGQYCPGAHKSPLKTSP